MVNWDEVYIVSLYHSFNVSVALKTVKKYWEKT